MKNTLLTIAAIVGAFLLAGSILGSIWFIATHFHLPEPPKAPVCVKWTDNYYWNSWAGNSYDTGTEDLDTAKEIAGGNPLRKFGPQCAEYN